MVCCLYADTIELLPEVFVERTRDGLSPQRVLEQYEYVPIPTSPTVSASASPSSSRGKPLESEEQASSDHDVAERMQTDEDEGYGGSEDEMDRSPRATGSRVLEQKIKDTSEIPEDSDVIGGKQKRPFEWMRDEPDDPYDAAYLPPLPGKKRKTSSSHDDLVSDSQLALPSTSTPARLSPEPDSATVERELTSRRANRTQLDPYTSAPIPYASSALRYAHHAPGVGTGFKNRSSGPRLPVRPLIPDTLQSLVKTYQAAKNAAKDPPQSVSARSYRATVADIVSHTTGHPAPFMLAAGTHQVPGSSKDHTGTIPRGSPYVPSYPVYASSGLPVNTDHEKDKKLPEVYPTSRLSIKTEETYPPTLALSLQPSPRHFDPSRPALLETVLTEFPGHHDPSRETYPFPRSSWLKPSLVSTHTRITPPTALRVDAARAAEEGLNEGDLALYGEPVRAPGQPDPEGKAAKRAREKKKLKEKGLVGVPKIRFTINESAPNAGDVNMIGPDGQLIGGDKVEEKEEILLRATWPISEERGDWQTRLELPEEDASSTGNLIAYGWGRRPLSVTSGTPMEPDSVGQRLGGIVKHPKIETPSYGPVVKTENGHASQASQIRRASSTASSHAGITNETPIQPPRSLKLKIKTPMSEGPPSTPGSGRAPPGSMLPPMTPTPGQEHRDDSTVNGSQASSAFGRTTSIKLKLPSRPNFKTSPSPGT